MSKPKAYPPYSVRNEGPADQWIVDAHGNDVVERIALSLHYDEIYGERIMEIICDALNREEQPTP